MYYIVVIVVVFLLLNLLYVYKLGVEVNLIDILFVVVFGISVIGLFLISIVDIYFIFG